MHKLPETHPEVLVSVYFIKLTPLFLLCEALLKPAKNLGIAELALGKPSLGHDGQTLPEHTEGLWTVRYNHHCLLDGRPRYVGRPNEQL